jgi:hypothetical protein
MAKKKDPAVAVLRYFETAEVGQATLVLALAKDTLSRRKGTTPAVGEAVGTKGPRRVQRTGAAAGSAAATGTPVPPPPGHAPLPGA